MKILVQKHPHGHRNLIQWSPDGRRWYPINERNVVPVRNGDPDPFKALDSLHFEALNLIATIVSFVMLAMCVGLIKKMGS